MGNFYKRILDHLDHIKGDNITWEQIILKQRELENETNKKITSVFAETIKKHFKE